MTEIKTTNLSKFLILCSIIMVLLQSTGLVGFSTYAAISPLLGCLLVYVTRAVIYIAIVVKPEIVLKDIYVWARRMGYEKNED